MAQVQLADIIEPALFTEYVRVQSTEKNSFFASNVIAQTEQLNALASGPSDSFTIPHWNPLASDEPNVGSDDPGTTSTPKKITAGKQVGTKQRRNQSWSAMDIIAPVAGSDPMAVIVDGVANYWARVFQKILVQICLGVYADNAANDGGDMIVNISDDAAGAPGAATLIQASAVINAWATLGDAAGSIVAIGMHSVPYVTLQKEGLIDNEPTFAQNVGFGSYLGKTVIVDDGFPVDTTPVNQTHYTTVLFGAGAFGYGEGDPVNPTEVKRDPDSGNGEGQETLFSRRHFTMHPLGFEWLAASMAGTTPTNAELAAAANWSRVYDRKLCPIAFIKSNG